MKILCITDQVLFRDGLALLLRQAFVRSTFFHAEACEAAVAMLRDHPNLSAILLAHSQRRANTDCVSVLRAVAPRVPIVVLVDDEDGDWRDDVVGGDSLRVLSKRAPTEVLLDILRHQIAQFVPVTTLRRRHLHIARGTLPMSNRFRPRLTLREEQVLALLMRGMENKRIANHLGIACEGTVKQHVSSVLEKLDARNRTEAVVKAVVMGFTPQLRN